MSITKYFLYKLSTKHTTNVKLFNIEIFLLYKESSITFILNYISNEVELFNLRI